MKERGVDSPDIADALALTFAFDVAPLGLPKDMFIPRPVMADYDPLEVQW